MKIDKFVMRAVTEFVIAAVILGIAYNVIYDKVDTMLINALKESVAQQSQSTAYTMKERFQHKLDELQARADLLEQQDAPLDTIMNVDTYGTKEGRMRGILRRDNSPVVGVSLPDEAFWGVTRAFEGEQVLDYVHGFGLVFAVPFSYNGDEYVFYEVFNDESVKSFYKVISYNGKGTLLLVKDSENWVMLTEGLYPEIILGKYPLPKYMGLDTSKITNFDSTLKKMVRTPLLPGKTNMFYAENEVDAFFFHVTHVSEKDHLALVGYVEWDDIVVGDNHIYTLMRIVIVSVYVLLLLFVCYHYKKKQAQQMEHERIVAESANKAKSDFLANMSHEIRTPINAIMGMGEMILRESKEPATLQYACQLKSATKNLLRIINDILDFSKIEAGKFELIPVDYQLSSLLNELTNMVDARANDKGLMFEVEVNGDVPDALYGDEIRLRQVIVNLLSNAVKYTERGTISFCVDFEKIDDETIYLYIEVSDTGIGIKEEDLKKLFAAFERIEEERNRTIEGTGLGMTISRRILDMMGTSLDVKSIYGQGSIFSFRVKQKVRDFAPMGDFEEAYKKSLKYQQKKRESFVAPNALVLIVDDTEMNLVVAKGLLKQTGIQIDTALSGRKCLDMVAEKKYDIIFLDHMMPDMDGIETLHEIKKLPNNINADTPIISLTANAIHGMREKYLAEGFDDYITKPIIFAVDFSA